MAEVLKSSMNSPSLDPSVRRKTGSTQRAPRRVVRANWLPTEPMRSERPSVSMSFLFSFERKAAKTLAMHAASRAHTEKSSSLIEARQTPPMTGMRQSHLACEIDLPYSVVPTTAANAGSDALTIWANETAPRFMLKIEARCAPAAQPATGRTFMTSSMETWGRGRQSGASQRKRAYTEPMSSCMKPMVTGKPVAPPAAFRASLLLSV
mmetsp:Transcript_32847/g.77671  ORF Transcript_32847/g.77671 Transcript_32847/m.77671 type:complete len:208 (-) Transcript_32847:274-897(-)